MFSFAEIFFSRGGHTEVKINTFINAKRERGFSVRPRAALPVFFILFFLFGIGKDRIDIRSSRRCGIVRKLLAVFHISIMQGLTPLSAGMLSAVHTTRRPGAAIRGLHRR